MSTDVLIVTDDAEMGDIWGYALLQDGLVSASVSPDQVLGERVSPTWGAAIVDLYRPGAGLASVCRALRRHSGNPVLLLGAPETEAALLQAYAAGADDVVVRPVSPSVLVAKVQAWLRRSSSPPDHGPDVLICDGVRLAGESHRLTLQDGRTLHLPNHEYRLLHALMSQPHRTLSLAALLAVVWPEGGGSVDALRSAVHRLRQRIEPDPHHPRYIHTDQYQGYSFHAL